MTKLYHPTLLLALAAGSAMAQAPAVPTDAGSELALRLERCATLGDASARLACYDGLAKVAPAATVAAAAAGNSNPAQAAAALAAPIPVDAPARTQPAPPPAPPQVSERVAALTTIPPEAKVSPMVQSWELDRPSKRGVFNFKPHRDNYLLLANYSTSSNDDPFKEFTPAGIKAKHVELTYQLSFKMKALEQIGNTPIDLWFGYTQQSFWQAYNRAASSPFRETNYQPEVMLSTPLNLRPGGLDIRYAALGLVHQSNGQTSTLSRSWNRLYGELGAEYDKVGITFRLWKRLDNARSDNDNLDITDYMGHGDVRVVYRNNGNEFSVLGRRNFSTRHGALQAGWAFPVKANLKGYVQLFSGYGQSLIDYNYDQKSLGIGVLVDY